MPDALMLLNTKSELKKLIRANSDRGFLPYGGCNRVCLAMLAMLEQSETLENSKEKFDIHLYILLEVVKLVSHADTSSGLATDVVNECLRGIGPICLSAPIEHRQAMFASVIKTAQNKAFADWAEYGYRLLRQSVALVQTAKQAEAVYGTFAMLGSMYSGKEYPDRYWITHNITERLEGAAAAERYRMEHLHVAELRKMVVEEAIAAERYERAEKLCLEALSEDKRYGQPSDWAYELERIYTLSADTPKLIEIVQLILMKGARSYYPKLKKLYQADGTWEQRRAPLLQKLAKAYMAHDYAALLAEEGETELLLGVIKENPLMIADYGKQLAREFPVETYRVYEAYILNEAAEATDRRTYKAVCKVIRSYYDAGAKSEAIAMIQRLVEKYPRRPAMLDELEKLDKKLRD